MRFNALFDSVNVGSVNTLTKDCRSSVPFVLPNYNKLGAILDVIERDDARVVLIVPCWPHQIWFRNLHPVAWAGRIGAWVHISGAALMPNAADCYFGDRFTTDYLVFRTQALGVCDEGQVRQRARSAAGMVSATPTATGCAELGHEGLCCPTRGRHL